MGHAPPASFEFTEDADKTRRWTAAPGWPVVGHDGCNDYGSGVEFDGDDVVAPEGIVTNAIGCQHATAGFPVASRRPVAVVISDGWLTAGSLVAHEEGSLPATAPPAFAETTPGNPPTLGTLPFDGVASVVMLRGASLGVNGGGVVTETPAARPRRAS